VEHAGMEGDSVNNAAPFPMAFLKLAGQDFDATVYDTDDLSTIRGSSLTLLAVPPLVLERLQQRGDIRVEALQVAASELVAGLWVETGDGAPALEPQSMKPPKGIRKGRWNKAVQAAIAKIKQAGISDRSLKEAARAICGELGMDADRHGDNVARHLLARSGAAGKATTAGRAMPDAQLCEDIVADIRSFLGKPQAGLPLDLMHFAVSIHRQEPGQPYSRVMNRLDGDLRRQQLQKPTCPLPQSVPLSDQNDAICKLTHILPAEKGRKVKGKPVSSCALRRREVGRKGKTAFYRKVLQDALKLCAQMEGTAQTQPPADAAKQLEKGLEQLDGPLKNGFAEDFHQMVARPPEGVSLSVQANLALVTMDGNGFGQHRAAIMAEHGADGLKVFSDYLEIRKGVLLADVLDWICANAEDMISGDMAAFETLLWGGDEFCFVLPSWAGWPLVSQLGESIEDWRNPFDSETLFFSIGLAFAKAKAPVRASRNASDMLCSMAKHDRGQTLVQVAAYESIDSIAMEPDRFRADLFGAQLDEALFSIPVKVFSDMPARADALFSRMGRSGLVRWLEANRERVKHLTPDNEAVAREIMANWKEMETRIGEPGSASTRQDEDENPGRNVMNLVQTILLKDYIREGAKA